MIRIVTAPASDPPKHSSGVYQIRCKNGKVYVGSAVCIAKRWGYHKQDLRAGRHSNSLLQRAWDKYGEASFSFEVIELVPVADLIQAEQIHMDRLMSYAREYGFNINPTAGSNLGKKFSAEVRANISAAAKRRAPQSEETRRKISIKMLGNKHLLGHVITDETRAKLIAARQGQTPALGKPCSEELKQKLREKFAGRVFSPEWLAKIAATKKRNRTCQSA